MKFENMRVNEIVAVVRYNTNMRSWRARDRKNHIIGIKLEGSALHDLGYKSFVLSRNQIYYFNQRDDYDVEVYEPGESFSVHFTTTEEIESESFAVAVQNTTEIISILRRAESAKGRGDELGLCSLVYKLLAELRRAQEVAYAPSDSRVAVARDYIDSHLAVPDCLSRAISESGVTARRFGDLFKFAVGSTPNRYLVTRRIERAKELLTVEDISVSEVADLSGFSDVYYFSKVFKRETGVPPSKWLRIREK